MASINLLFMMTTEIMVNQKKDAGPEEVVNRTESYT